MGGGNSGDNQIASGATQGATTGAAAGPVGAGIGGIIGGIGGMMSAQKASDYENQQKESLRADQAKRDAYVAQQEARYAPTQQKLLEEAANPSPLNYGLNLGNINEQSQKSEQRLNATMAAHGMTGSGLQGAGLQGIEKGRVGELASAFNTGLQARTNLGMNLLQHYNPLGNAQFGAAALPEQMKFGAGEQGLYNKGMEQGFGAVGKGLSGFLNGLPGQRPEQQPFQTNVDPTMQPLMGGEFGYTPYPTRPGMTGTPELAQGPDQNASMAQTMFGGQPGVPAETSASPDMSGLNFFSNFDTMGAQ